jgi:hypothetical protein
MDEYLIETDSAGGYQVRTTRSSGEHNAIVATFSSHQEAQDWVDTQARIGMKAANASDVA